MRGDSAMLFYLDLALVGAAAQLLLIGALSVHRPRLPVLIRRPSLADAIARAKARRGAR